jgi:hypothetical protein
MSQDSNKSKMKKQKGTDQTHLFSSIFHKIIMSCFFVTILFVGQAQLKFSIYGGIQRTIPFRKILIDPQGGGVFRDELKSSGWEGGLKYSHYLLPFLSISAESGYARYGYFMVYDRTKIDHHYLQSNFSIALHPLFKSRFKPLQSLYIGGGPGMNYYLGTSSPDPLKYIHDMKWIVNSKISLGISLYHFTISPYWVTFLTHINDTDHGNFQYKEFFKAYGVSLSYDIIRKAKTESPPITP